MKLAFLAAAAFLPAATPADAPAPQPGPAPGFAPRSDGMPNGLSANPTCLPIVQQVQGDADRPRDNDVRTLDREPPAHLLRAVDRHVDGCREVTFIRRDAAPGARTLGEPTP